MRGRVLRFALLLLLIATATRQLLAQKQAEEPRFTRETTPAPEIPPSDQVCADFELKRDSLIGRSCQSLAQLAMAGRWQEARPLAEKLARELPSNGIGPYWLGLMELQAGNTISAFRRLDTALSLSPDVFWIHLNLGLCYALLRQYVLFEKEMQWVMNKHPSQPLPYYYLGRHYSKTREDTDRGLALLQRAVSLNPADFRARYHLGYLLELKDRHEEAKAAYQQASEGAAAHRSSYSWPLQGLARLYLQEANLAEALRYARMAVIWTRSSVRMNCFSRASACNVARPVQPSPLWNALRFSTQPILHPTTCCPEPMHKRSAQKRQSNLWRGIPK